MSNPIADSPLVQHPKPWWLPLVSLVISLYGVGVLHWSLKPLIFLFWWEVILLVASAIIRMLGAMGGTASLWYGWWLKLQLLIGGVFFGGMFILFSVVFTIRSFDDGSDYSHLAGIHKQIYALSLGHLVGLLVHYFGNGYFRKADPATEIIGTFIYLLMLLAILQAFTMHLIPTYPQLNQAKWVAIALISVKFVADSIFLQVRKVL